MLIREEYWQFMHNVKAIPVEFLHALVIVDADDKKIRNVIRNTCIESIRISMLKHVKVWK